MTLNPTQASGEISNLTETFFSRNTNQAHGIAHVPVDQSLNRQTALNSLLIRQQLADVGQVVHHEARGVLLQLASYKSPDVKSQRRNV